MKKAFSATVVIFLMLFMEQLSFAKKVCLQDNFTGYWELSGGKPDKKTYTAKLIVPGFCEVGGYADATKMNSETLRVSLFNSHDTSGVCVPVLFSATTNENFTGSGTYDSLADGSIGGSFSLTRIDCSSIPDAASIQTFNHPALKERIGER